MSTERVKQRELKFRVWDKQTKQMSPPFGLLGEFTLIGGVHAWQHECGNKAESSLEALGDLIEMQFTGLHDKSGKEIYEGDRVRLLSPPNQIQRKSLISEIGFFDGAFCAYWRETEIWEGFNVAPNSVVFLNCITKDQIEVIGNIYSSPSSIEESKAPITKDSRKFKNRIVNESEPETFTGNTGYPPITR